MEREFDHAGFVETSLMLAISKNVKMKSAKKGLITDGMSEQEVKNLGRIANQSFPKATKMGFGETPQRQQRRRGQQF